MPGHIIAVSCSCGFSGEGAPGFTLSGGREVMAYDAAAIDGELFVTITEAEATERGLPIIEDPALGRNPLEENYAGPWGGENCPRCQKATMTLALRGFWS